MDSLKVLPSHDSRAFKVLFIVIHVTSWAIGMWLIWYANKQCPVVVVETGHGSTNATAKWLALRQTLDLNVNLTALAIDNEKYELIQDELIKWCISYGVHLNIYISPPSEEEKKWVYERRHLDVYLY